MIDIIILSFCFIMLIINLIVEKNTNIYIANFVVSLVVNIRLILELRVI